MPAKVLAFDEDVEALLAEAQLPTADLATSRSLSLLGLREEGRLVGVVGIEVHGRVGLLRSLAVIPTRRNAGIGTGLVSSAEAWAAERGVETLYLLTTTAADFFARQGYEALSRSEAPTAIAATAQFSDLCPGSSSFMRKELGAGSSRQRTVAADGG